MSRLQRLIERVAGANLSPCSASVGAGRGWRRSRGDGGGLRGTVVSLVPAQAVIPALVALSVIPFVRDCDDAPPQLRQVARLIDDRSGGKELFLTLLDHGCLASFGQSSSSRPNSAGEIAPARSFRSIGSAARDSVVALGLVAAAVVSPQLDPSREAARQKLAARAAAAETKKVTEVRREQLRSKMARRRSR